MAASTTCLSGGFAVLLRTRFSFANRFKVDRLMDLPVHSGNSAPACDRLPCSPLPRPNSQSRSPLILAIRIRQAQDSWVRDPYFRFEVYLLGTLKCARLTLAALREESACRHLESPLLFSAMDLFSIFLFCAM